MRRDHHRRRRAGVATLLLLLVAAAPAYADARVHYLADGGHAGSADALRFELRSTKAGFIGTTVHGHVRRFDVSYHLDGERARDVRVSFPVREMTTRHGERDAKMRSFCLDAEHHPRIDVAIPGPITPGFSGSLPARMRVRGRWRPITVAIEARTENGRTRVHGRARVSLRALGVPDPSIWIARVEDAIDVTFRVQLGTSRGEGRS